MNTRTLLVQIGIVCAVALAVVLLGQSPSSAPKGNSETAHLAPPPAISERSAAVLAASKGFQHLVSYTDAGFEPTSLTVKTGDTVRFTNNSSRELWIAAQRNAQGIYPRGSADICGASALDTCSGLPPNEFWEFTFDISGTWNFANNGNLKHEGTIIVQSQ